MRTIKLRDGLEMPNLGLGTWHMGEDPRERANEIAALRAGVEQGISLIDTAEMYGDGGAEEVVGEAVHGQRDRVFIVSKVYPHNASRRGAVEACERSLQRLGIDCIDLYLLHWRGSVPLGETIAAFEQLKANGKIRSWGVSNFDVSDMADLQSLATGSQCASNQVLYHLGERGIEWELLSKCEQDGIPIMAYSPLGQGVLLRDRTLQRVADKYGVGTATIAVAWVMRWPNVIAIPKTSRVERVKQIASAANHELDEDDLAALNAAFPPPTGPTPLAIN